MLNAIQTIANTRSYLLKTINDLSIEQLNRVPTGFNNNIVWNVGHLIAAQQGICYSRCSLKPVVDEKYLAPFRPGTRPEQPVEQAELDMLFSLLISSLDQLDRDYQHHLFDGYTAWVTRYGVNINNIDEAIRFLAFHEGLHSGAIIALMKLV